MFNAKIVKRNGIVHLNYKHATGDYYSYSVELDDGTKLNKLSPVELPEDCAVFPLKVGSWSRKDGDKVVTEITLKADLDAIKTLAQV